jgi:hypothetical protein
VSGAQPRFPLISLVMCILFTSGIKEYLHVLYNMAGGAKGGEEFYHISTVKKT